MASLSSEKKDIRHISPDEIQHFLKEQGEPAFRAKQIQEWLWKKSAGDFDEMTNLSLKIRSLLKEHFEIRKISVKKKQLSSDKTIKYAFDLHDQHLIEGVLIPADDRMTACVSSQVGCSLSCKFCATGYMPRKRNLDPGEIYDQVVLLNQAAELHYGHPLSNIVFMGMGEPLLNYQNVVKAIEWITSPKGLHMSSKRITVSTAGIAKMIHRLAEEAVKFNLALSLHAADEEKRNEIMPINESNNLKVLGEALAHFYRKTKNRITLEYIALDHFNDSLEDAKKLYEFSKYAPCKVNIIEYNPIREANFARTAADRLDHFAQYLSDKGLAVSIRRSRGKDIDAACGQLANQDK